MIVCLQKQKPLTILVKFFIYSFFFILFKVPQSWENFKYGFYISGTQTRKQDRPEVRQAKLARFSGFKSHTGKA
jgi:hypothetical protein